MTSNKNDKNENYLERQAERIEVPFKNIRSITEVGNASDSSNTIQQHFATPERPDKGAGKKGQK